MNFRPAPQILHHLLLVILLAQPTIAEESVPAPPRELPTTITTAADAAVFEEVDSLQWTATTSKPTAFREKTQDALSKEPQTDPSDPKPPARLTIKGVATEKIASNSTIKVLTANLLL